MRVLHLAGALALNAALVFGSPITSTSELAKRADEPFGLFVYGPDVGGLQIMYKDGAPWAVGPNVDAYTQGFTNITFSFTATGSRQLAIAPVNSTAFNSTLLFGITKANDTSTNQKRSPATIQTANSTDVFNSTASTVSNNSTLGFSPASSSGDDYETDGWVFYGNSLLFVDSSGLVSRFYVPSNGSESGVALGWIDDGETISSDNIPVAVRKVRASHA